MKPPVILLLTADPSARRVVQDAVIHTRHGIREAGDSRAAFRALCNDVADVDLAIVDLDPGMHGMALLEGASARLPVLALTSLEAQDMTPVAQRHGASACLGKPLGEAPLREAIARFSRHTHAAS